jgi:hypothetical protein
MTIDKTIISQLATAAQKGTLDKIPKVWFTKESLTALTNSEEDTVLHMAARNRNLKQIPQEFLTNELLTIEGYNGHTPIQLWAGSHKKAYDNKEPDIIPPNLLTEKNLLSTNNIGNCALFYAAKYGNLNAIPYPILKKHKKVCLKIASVEKYEQGLESSKNEFLTNLRAKLNRNKKSI